MSGRLAANSERQPANRPQPFQPGGVPSGLAMTLASALRDSSRAPRRPWHAAIALLILVSLSYPLFFHRLADRDLWSSHEARAAQNAQSMLDSWDWRLPRLHDGRIETQKPPLHYWLAAAIGWLAGGRVDAWAVRLPSALAGLGTVLLVFGFLASRGRTGAGLLAGTMLATFLHFTWISRVGRIDLPLTFAVASALLAFVSALQRCASEPRRPAWPLLGVGYAAVSATVLLKGLIGPLLIGGALLAWTALEARRRAGDGTASVWRAWCSSLLVRSGAWWGIPLVLVLCGPWFLCANHATGGEFFRDFFYRHTLQRGLGGDELLARRDHPWWLYLAHLGPNLLPWSLLLPAAFWAFLRDSALRSDPFARLGLCWFAVMLVLLSCSQFKRADYLLPAYPAAALFLGVTGDHWLRRRTGKLRAASIGAVSTLALGCGIGWIIHTSFVLPAREPQRELRSFAAAVREHAPAPATVVMFRSESHLLAFHLGRPVKRVWEWEGLDVIACRDEPAYVVMPVEWAGQWPQFMEAGRLYRVAANTPTAAGFHETPLVFFRTKEPAGQGLPPPAE